MNKGTHQYSDVNKDDLERSIEAREAKAFPAVEKLFTKSIDFLQLLDDIAIGMAILSLDRKIVVMNQTLRTLTGFNQADLNGVACRNILRSNVCLNCCPALEVKRGTGPKCVEGNLINQDRKLIPIRITSAPIKSLKGETIGFLETVEDISLLSKLDVTDNHAYKFSNIIGRSPEMEKIFQILPSLAQSDSSVLITGETGTGKDMLAEAIHHSSNRARGTFVKINCGALPETLLESELFGHRKGAFTGAVENKMGRFQLAHNGTLYLTEIGDLPLSLQVKLLTFLDDKEIFPLGSVKGLAADVRVIAATHRNLEKRAGDNRFRKDLLYRLNVVRVHLPPLRERYGDIQLLIDHFINSFSAQLSKKALHLSSEAWQVLKTYHYPGNVRELKNIIEYVINIVDNDEVKPEDLPSYVLEAGQIEANATIHMLPPGNVLEAGDDGPKNHNVRQGWPEIEKQMIMGALLKAGGRKNRAAAALRWSRSTLWRKMKHHGIL